MNMKIKKNLQHKFFAGKIMKVLQWRSALTMKFKFWAFISSLQSLTLDDVTYLLYECGIICWAETLFHYQGNETVV